MGTPTSSCTDPQCKTLVENIKGLCPECVKNTLSDGSISDGKKGDQSTQTSRGKASKSNGAKSKSAAASRSARGIKAFQAEQKAKALGRLSARGLEKLFDCLVKGYGYSSPGLPDSTLWDYPLQPIAKTTALQLRMTDGENTQEFLKTSAITPLLSGISGNERVDGYAGCSMSSAGPGNATAMQSEQDDDGGPHMKRRQRYSRWLVGGLARANLIIGNSYKTIE
ncbi:hypothetical protein TWF696_007958 [Orbilia brochopaga]|uniref:Uncharacterized protein n=1 Tax=Orbilia brochopaga TaxID=3140254 RepID=A0AAV9ULP5_9PEZI